MARLQYNQTIEDLAITQCGSAEAAFDIALLNGVSISDTLLAGTLLKNPNQVAPTIVDYFINKKMQPATDIQTTAGRIFDERFEETFQ